MKYKNQSCTNITVPQKYVFDFKEYIFPINIFTFHRLENVYPENTSVYLKFGLHDSKRNWPHLGSKSHTWISKKKYKFHSGKSYFHSELPRTVILAGHFSWFGTCVLSTEILTCTALWEHSASALMVQWQNTCMRCRGAWVQIQVVMFTTFSLWHPWEPRFKSGIHNSFWDYVVPDRIPWMTLELYEWNLGTSFG